MGVRNDGVRRRPQPLIDTSATSRPKRVLDQPAPAEVRPKHTQVAAWAERLGAGSGGPAPATRSDAPVFRGRVGAGPFRGGQPPPTSPTTTPTSPGAPPTETIDVTNRNYELMRRFDRNEDGILERGELNEAVRRAGQTRIMNEGQELTTRERQQLVAVSQRGVRVRLQYRGSNGARGIGIGSGQMRWNDVRSRLYADASGDTASVGRVGQGRVRNTTNLDCGPTCALFMHDRREAAAGRAPTRTHAQADAMIRSMAMSGGTTAPQMAGILNDNFRHSGGRFYTYGQHTVSSATLPAELARGLAADPGGVMVPVVSTFNATSQSGTRHWFVVTDVQGDRVSYYDPAGPDGAQHMRTMSLRELQGMLPRSNAISPNQIVYGTSVAESSLSGALRAGTRIGELEVAGSNPDLHTISTHGVFGQRSDAQAAAQRVAAATGKDAIVRREGNAFAVYGITEIRSQFGGYWSDNTLADLDANITDVYMTDPTSRRVRRAASGPPP
jgi:hypothetical protein